MFPNLPTTKNMFGTDFFLLIKEFPLAPLNHILNLEYDDLAEICRQGQRSRQEGGGGVRFEKLWS
jgi:hypothetical protein